jgi:hypothetical protein
LRTLSRLRAATIVLSKVSTIGHRRSSLLELVEEQVRTTAAVATEIEQLRAEMATHRDTLDAAVQAGRQQITSSLSQSAARLDDYRGEVDTALAYALRNVALVRYDAFDDLAGRMSFTLALLDDNADGLTLSSIAGRSDTRMYAKGVRAGASDHELSPEEVQAIAAAIRQQGQRSASLSQYQQTQRTQRRPGADRPRPERRAS